MSKSTTVPSTRPEGAEREELLDAAAHGMPLAYWAARQPDASAITCEHGDRTYSELNGRVNQLARALRDRGLGAGDALSIMMANRPEYAETYFATQRTGIRITPLNWHLTGDEAGYILDDCDAKVFVADARFADAAIEAAERAPDAQIRIAVGGEIDGFERYDEFIAAFADTDIDDPVVGSEMLYTSGTTGRPKGVIRPQSPEIARARVAGYLDGSAEYVPGESIHLLTGPLYHAAPLAISLTAPIVNGASVVIMDRWSADETLRLIEKHRITHTHMVATMFHRLLSLPAEVREAADISSVKHVNHGAAPCPVSVKQAMIEWFGPVVHEYYAATEGSATKVNSEEWLARPGTVGKPAPDQIRILDDDGRPLPAGEIGTVYLKAPPTGGFNYYKDPDKTVGSYRDSHFTMGDIGYLDEGGYLFLTDRSANLIISGGVNVYPAEIEAALISHPAVGDIAVIGVPDDEWGEKVVAVVEPHDGVEPSDELAADIIAYARANLAHFKCPRQVDFRPELPRHDSGKLYKRLLRDEYRAAAAAAGR